MATAHNHFYRLKWKLHKQTLAVLFLLAILTVSSVAIFHPVHAQTTYNLEMEDYTGSGSSHFIWSPTGTYVAGNTYAFTSGTDVTFTAVPDTKDNYVFTEWRFTNGGSFTDNPHVLTVTSDNVIFASFNLAASPTPTPGPTSTPNPSTSTSNLILPMNEGTGTTTADISGNGYTGTLVSATWTTGLNGNNALSFNGASSYVDLPYTIGFTTNTKLTMAAYIYPQNITAQGALFTQHVSNPTTESAVFLYQTANQLQFWANANHASVTSTFPDGQTL